MPNYGRGAVDDHAGRVGPHAKRGTLTAEAEIVHRGHTTLAVEVTVLDDERRLLARLVATQLAPAAPPATASADRPVR